MILIITAVASAIPALPDPNLSGIKLEIGWKKGRKVQERPAFGRRATMAQAGTAAAALPVRSPAAPMPRPVPKPHVDEWSSASDELSPEAEAFRREMRNGPKSSDAQFDDWRKSQSFGRLMTVVLRIALMTPGALVYYLHAPKSVSLVLEVAGFGLGWWIKHLRKRYIRTVVDWKDPLDAL
eukprot:gene12325-12412_t